MIRLTQPQSEGEWRLARELIEEYAAALKVDLCFQDLEHELAHLPQEYGPPAGAFLLAEENGVLLGCIGLRRIAEGVGEVKRLYVRPAARGRGAGRLLAEGIVAAARRLGYARLRLDTLPDMKEAQALYATLGFEAIPAYRFNPVPGTVFLELSLAERKAL
ncbi:MAG TPA: GNAT family N-acetyltransferase [Burkholderiales bacterium]|nr:GNAT family N-acetyltransferase [Burkholderiales bacterium]